MRQPGQEPQRWTCAHCGRLGMVLGVADCPACGKPRDATAAPPVPAGDAAVREWALAHAVAVSSRGPVGVATRQAYQEAHS